MDTEDDDDFVILIDKWKKNDLNGLFSEFWNSCN